MKQAVIEVTLAFLISWLAFGVISELFITPEQAYSIIRPNQSVARTIAAVSNE